MTSIRSGVMVRVGREHAENQLALLSAGTAERRREMQNHARTLMEEVDWSRMGKLLTVQGLMPVLGSRILELGGPNVSTEFASLVRGATVAARRQGAMLLLAGDHVMSALADAGIRAVPLKGPALGIAIYGDAGMRLSTDIDVLVNPQQLADAVEVVRALGYGRPTDYVDRSGFPRLHYALTHEQDSLPPVELHWRIHWYERTFASDRLLPPVGESLEGWRPLPTDELAALLLFYARDGFAGLRLATDLGAWWDAFGRQVPDGALDGIVDLYPALARAINVAVTAADTIVGLPGTRILGSTTFSMRNALAARLANPNARGSPHQRHVDTTVIDALLTPRGGFRALIRRNVLLPRKLFTKYAREVPEWRARSPVTYGLRVLARSVLSLIRAAGGTYRPR